MGLYRLGITNIQLLEDLSLSLLYQMFCNFFFFKLQIFRPTSRACETIGLVGTAPKSALVSSEFHALSNGNNESSWKYLVPEIEPVRILAVVLTMGKERVKPAQLWGKFTYVLFPYGGFLKWVQGTNRVSKSDVKSTWFFDISTELWQCDPPCGKMRRFSICHSNQHLIYEKGNFIFQHLNAKSPSKSLSAMAIL